MKNEENIKINTYLKDLARNEKSFKPNDDYDTETVNNAIECILTKDNSEVAKIHIPIHLLFIPSFDALSYRKHIAA